MPKASAYFGPRIFRFLADLAANNDRDWFKATFEMEGESLKRPPRGYDAEHPLIEDLKRKDFILVAKYSKKDLGGVDFLSRFAKDCRTASGFMKFLAEGAGVGF